VGGYRILRALINKLTSDVKALSSLGCHQMFKHENVVDSTWQQLYQQRMIIK